MIKFPFFTSVRGKVLLALITMLTAIGCSIYVITIWKTTSFSEEYQRQLYEERLDNIFITLEQDERRLQKTGLVEAYQQSFQEIALRDLRETYATRTLRPYILNSSGKEILWSDQEVLKKSVASIILDQGEERFELDKPAGSDIWVIGRHFSPWGWKLLFVVPETMKQANARNTSRQLVSVILGVLLLGAALLLAVVSSLTRPITTLTQAAISISKGDWNHEIPKAGKGEVGLLAVSFQTMRDAIHEQLREKEIEIKERKRIEQALRDRESDLRITLDAIGDAVITTDAEGLITRMNPVASTLTGWRLEDALGNPLKEVMKLHVGGSEEKVFDPVKAVLEKQVIINLPHDTILESKTGERYRVADSGAPIRNEESNSVGVVIVFRDITEEYAMQEQLSQSRKMDAIGQLAGGVAHDFNNMLAGIYGAAELLGIILSDQEKELKHINLIKSAAEQASVLTGKLLAFSRKGKQLSTPVDLHNIVHDVIAILERTIDKSITIETELTAKEFMVIGDPSQLQSGILNVCVNARDAMPDGGTIRFSTSDTEFLEGDREINTNFRPGSYIKLSIEDTGIGIPSELQHKIFEPFFTTKEVGKGTGLGLAAFYGMVKDHSGNIQLYSEPDKGTVFHIFLPVTRVDVLTQKTKNENIVQGSGTILVVDDEDLIRATASLLLENLGYTVLLATNGEEAVDIYLQQRKEIDLVILDMVMPVMDGSKALAKLLEINPEVKVILSSGYTKNVKIAELEKQGLAGSITKPFTQLELSKLIAEVLTER